MADVPTHQQIPQPLVNQKTDTKQTTPKISYFNIYSFTTFFVSIVGLLLLLLSPFLRWGASSYHPNKIALTAFGVAVALTVVSRSGKRAALIGFILSLFMILFLASLSYLAYVFQGFPDCGNCRTNFLDANGYGPICAIIGLSILSLSFLAIGMMKNTRKQLPSK